MTYVVRGLDPAPYRHLFAFGHDELARRGMLRMIVAQKPGFCCRVSLTDRELEESVLLLNHVSHEAANPYRASHAVFIAENSSEAARYVDEVPPIFAYRVMSLRGFDRDGMMTDAALAAAGDSDAVIRKLFENTVIETIHAHNAARGCFAALIERN